MPLPAAVPSVNNIFCTFSLRTALKLPISVEWWVTGSADCYSRRCESPSSAGFGDSRGRDRRWLGRSSSDRENSGRFRRAALHRDRSRTTDARPGRCRGCGSAVRCGAERCLAPAEASRRARAEAFRLARLETGPSAAAGTLPLTPIGETPGLWPAKNPQSSRTTPLPAGDFADCRPTCSDARWEGLPAGRWW